MGDEGKSKRLYVVRFFTDAQTDAEGWPLDARRGDWVDLNHCLEDYVLVWLDSHPAGPDVVRSLGIDVRRDGPMVCFKDAPSRTWSSELTRVVSLRDVLVVAKDETEARESADVEGHVYENGELISCPCFCRCLSLVRRATDDEVETWLHGMLERCGDEDGFGNAWFVRMCRELVGITPARTRQVLRNWFERHPWPEAADALASGSITEFALEQIDTTWSWVKEDASEWWRPPFGELQFSVDEFVGTCIRLSLAPAEVRILLDAYPEWLRTHHYDDTSEVDLAGEPDWERLHVRRLSATRDDRLCAWEPCAAVIMERIASDEVAG